MIFRRITTEGLAAKSYFIGSGREAVVIDPRRDIEAYLLAADGQGMDIKYVLETHRHEDFLLGSPALKAQRGAVICRGVNDAVRYADVRLKDGDMLSFGDLLIKTLEAPGHTMDSLSYVLYDPDHSNVALMVFTGDTLMAGSCGRVDFYGEERKSECAGLLYRSLHEKLLPLGDQVIVCPAHGAGSVCGAGISDLDDTTLGYERRDNPWLSYDRETFVSKKAAEKPPYPPYFRRMERGNEEGPKPFMPCNGPKPVSPEELAALVMEHSICLLDTRMPQAFAGGHIPGALSIWLGGTALFPGWVADPARPIYLVTERPQDVATVVRYLARIGFDRVEGWLRGGFEAWQNRGMPIGHIGAISVDALKAMSDAGGIRIIDVRGPDEWQGGIMPHAEMRYVGTLKDNLPDGPKAAPIAVTCSVGHRGSIGASILENAGFTNVYNVLGGTTAWKSRGFPMVKPEQ